MKFTISLAKQINNDELANAVEDQGPYAAPAVQKVRVSADRQSVTVECKDDTVEAVTTRVQKYHSETEPIVPFYEDKGILKRVDGVGDPDEITKRITAVLKT